MSEVNERINQDMRGITNAFAGLSVAVNEASKALDCLRPVALMIQKREARMGRLRRQMKLKAAGKNWRLAREMCG